MIFVFEVLMRFGLWDETLSVAPLPEILGRRADVKPTMTCYCQQRPPKN
jgi:hypothetical protein